jgi:hypothetical protein
MCLSFFSLSLTAASVSVFLLLHIHFSIKKEFSERISSVPAQLFGQKNSESLSTRNVGELERKIGEV